MHPDKNNAFVASNSCDEAGKHYEPVIGVARLMRLVESGADLSNLVNMAAYNPDDANLLMNLSMVFQLTGNREVAFEIQAKALAMRRLYHLPAQTAPVTITLLALMRPGDMMDNTPLDFLLEESGVALNLLYVSTEHTLPSDIPEHDVLFVAIGESIENAHLLEKIGTQLATWPRPVINFPDKIMQLSRDRLHTLLGTAEGVALPVTVRIQRQTLIQIAHGECAISDFLGNDSFPIIIRPLDAHAGRDLKKLAQASDLHDYLTGVKEDEFYISRFFDYRSADGLFRKFRIAMIAGHPFACHMAISEQWMVHYKHAGMSDSAEKRAEEDLFMTNFDIAFAVRHAMALHAIHERIGLDYFIIDCGETAEGRLLIFELDNRGFVHAMDPVDLFPYKQPVMKKLFKAFRTMLVHTAQP